MRPGHTNTLSKALEFLLHESTVSPPLLPNNKQQQLRTNKDIHLLLLLREHKRSKSESEERQRKRQNIRLKGTTSAGKLPTSSTCGRALLFFFFLLLPLVNPSISLSPILLFPFFISVYSSLFFSLSFSRRLWFVPFPLSSFHFPILSFYLLSLAKLSMAKQLQNQIYSLDLLAVTNTNTKSKTRRRPKKKKKEKKSKHSDHPLQTALPLHPSFSSHLPWKFGPVYNRFFILYMCMYIS
ncbi:hypothetical protein BKA57DRAFT_220416 [Linnemannia elongata]|nr:hypothetical protein BKA57DRAFT_220416 [Linnemannia elongata]